MTERPFALIVVLPAVPAAAAVGRISAPRRRSHRGDDVKIALAILMALVIVGCSDVPKDGRYQTGGGSWDNFRAEATGKTERWS